MKTITLLFQLKTTGKGFDAMEILTENHKSLGGNGLINMAQRAKNLGGEFLIDSSVGKGTIVTLEIPLKKQKWLENFKLSKTT